MALNKTEKDARRILSKNGFDVYRMTTELDEVPTDIKKYWSLKRKLRAGKLYTREFLESGIPDFLAVKGVQDYKFVEVKSSKGKLSSSQIRWMKNWSSTFDTWIMKEQELGFNIREQVGTQRELEWKEKKRKLGAARKMIRKIKSYMAAVISAVLATAIGVRLLPSNQQDNRIAGFFADLVIISFIILVVPYTMLKKKI